MEVVSMVNGVCDECKRCYNYHVSELGCWGSSLPCNSYVGDADDSFSDDDDDDYDDDDDDIDELDNEDGI